jgi:hypothetical protein
VLIDLIGSAPRQFCLRLYRCLLGFENGIPSRL